MDELYECLKKFTIALISNKALLKSTKHTHHWTRQYKEYENLCLAPVEQMRQKLQALIPNVVVFYRDFFDEADFVSLFKPL